MSSVIFKGRTITENDVLRAMSLFDQDRRQSFESARWRTYAVLQDGRLYPPKEILSMVTGLRVDQFVGGYPTNSRFEKLGFLVFSKDELAALRQLQREPDTDIPASDLTQPPLNMELGIAIHVGDSGDVVGRIRTNHCSGNVEGSALRKHIARAKGCRLRSTKRPSGSTKRRLDLPDPAAGEQEITQYVRAGRWKYAICSSPQEARDFQWYLINHIRPILNFITRDCNHSNRGRYQELLAAIEHAEALTHDQLKGKRTGPGVYILYHNHPPEATAAG